MSMILRSGNRPLHELPLVTLAAGVAVSKAIAAVSGAHVGLKWVNDLICGERKLGGILAETTGMATPYLVLGIGLNINLDASQLCDDLAAKVTSLHEHTSEPVDVNHLLAEICNEVEGLWQRLEAHDTKTILDGWRQRSVTLGRHVAVQIADRRVEGMAHDISETGALLLRTKSGEDLTLTAGEVQIRTLEGQYC
jgi:BirA family biotin operon repressor/biotin-[acetyl-CoA-carboxylase] ligase